MLQHLLDESIGPVKLPGHRSPELGQLIDEHSRCELRRLNCDFPYALAYVNGKSISPICGGH